MMTWWTSARLLRLLLGGLALATGLSFLGPWAWLLDILADFRVPYAVAAACLLLAALILKRGPAMALAAVLLAINGFTLAPYFDMASDDQAPLKVIHFNLNLHNKDTDATLDYLRRENADVVVVLEMTDAWRQALDTLSDIYAHRFFPPFCKCLNPKRLGLGIGILAKRAWEDAGVVNSEATNRTLAAWVRFPAASPSLTVAGVHMSAPFIQPAGYQEIEIDSLASMVKKINGPVIMAGDFNMTPFSARYGALLRKSGLRRAGGGLNASWPSVLAPLGLPIDHMLVGPGIARAVMQTGPQLGSDHLPVVGNFVLGH
ncbi:MAG: endonuclease/exonuclease/phosphatase family protein [Rhodospirillales bacterium]|nr:endonuclease/exonuclease/phosphatase family protein [Rhodospirillales bacterium]